MCNYILHLKVALVVYFAYGVEGNAGVSAEVAALKEENDSLKCQLAAYMNEGEMVKLEAKQTTEALERQITSLQNALKGMQQVPCAYKVNLWKGYFFKIPFASIDFAI